MKTSVKRKTILVCAIFGILFLTLGTVSYFSDTLNVIANGTTKKISLSVTGFDNETTKTISFNKIKPGDEGEFTLTIDMTGSDYDVAYSIDIERTHLPENLQFYSDSKHYQKLANIEIFADKTGTLQKEVTIYWYWDETKDNENDNLFMNTEISANIKIKLIQRLDAALMKNGIGLIYDAEYGWYPEPTTATEFWKEEYRYSIETITFSNDLSQMPTTCNEANLCWDISENGSDYPVYGYLVINGNTGTLAEETINLHDLYIVSLHEIYAPTNCTFMFFDFACLKSIDFNGNFNTINTNNMSYMFFRDESLISIDLSKFNTKNTTDMSNMFWYCSNLTSVNLSSFDTSNVIHMACMFSNCSSLTELDLSNFNTNNVTHMDSMFMSCTNLITLNLSSFNTSNVTNMSQMFISCSNIISLNLNNFNTSNVTDMAQMFRECNKLTTLNITSFDFSSVTGTSNGYDGVKWMFFGSDKLSTTINMNGSSIVNYVEMFKYAATNYSALITVNYTAETSTLVDNMILTKSANSHVVKGSLIS